MKKVSWIGIVQYAQKYWCGKVRQKGENSAYFGTIFVQHDKIELCVIVEQWNELSDN